MKLSTKKLRKITPVSDHTIIRYPSSDKSFPTVERIGRQNFYDEDAIYRWLQERADRENSIQVGDTLLSVEMACELLGRSKAWIWANAIKPNELTMIDLSPDGLSKNPRRYFIEREVREAFPQLIELADVAGLCGSVA